MTPNDVLNKRGIPAAIFAVLVLVGAYALAINSSFSQTSSYIQHYSDPSTPYPYKYNTVAASVTAQALTGGGGGATGDYLAGCTVTPATTTPGNVTILDNSTAIVSFISGTTTLVPFRITIDAISKLGAWKVTTTTNVSVVCNGSFT